MINAELDQTLLSVFDALNDRPIVYHKVYAKITGSILAGLLLAQLIYWSKAMKHTEFYKTNAELCEELGMSVDELKAAKKKIIQLSLFSIVVRGIPPTTYYTINLKILFTLISKYSDSITPINRWNFHQLEDGKSTDQMVEIPPNISEKTTEMTTEDNNNKSKVVGCAMAVAKKKLHVEPRAVVQPKPQPEPKLEPVQKSQEPDGSVVVDSEIDDLMSLIRGWAVSKVLLRTWAKKHGVGYVLQKIELTKSAISQGKVRHRGAYLNKAIELDWLPPAPHEGEEGANKPVEPTFPTHEENVAWYGKLDDNEKLAVLNEAVHKQGYFEGHLKNAKVSVLDADFTSNSFFKMMMGLVGRTA